MGKGKDTIRLLFAVDEWEITILSSNGSEADKLTPKDYVRFLWAYLLYGGRVSRKKENKCFVRRAYNVFRRLFTNSLKPGHSSTVE